MISMHLFGQTKMMMALMLCQVVLQKQIILPHMVAVGVQDHDHLVIVMVFVNHTTDLNGRYMEVEDLSKQTKAVVAAQHSYEVTNTDHLYKKKHKLGHTQAAQV
tara:strand:- start:345 stop:656 length:312 start_codon:yes stop_codon:yes gene_type:complete